MLQRTLLFLLLPALVLAGWCCAVEGAHAAPAKKPAAQPAKPPAKKDKPDRNTPPPFDMEAYMNMHKLLVQTLAEASEFMGQDKKSSPARAGVANYFLSEIEQARLQAENCFDLVFLYFDHFLKADAVSNIMAGYVGNRLRHLSHNMEDLLAELGPNLGKSPYAQDARFANLIARLTSYQLQVAALSQRIIPVQ
ncbi:hypothetical protein [Megalodesulfovibrio paquesii]